MDRLIAPHQPPPWWGLFFTALAACTLGFFGLSGAGPYMTLPFVLLAVVCYGTPARRFRGRLTSEGLIAERPIADQVPFAEVIELYTVGRCRRSAENPPWRELHVRGGNSLTGIPQRQGAPRVLLEWLLARVGWSTQQPIDARLREYWQSQIDTFGPERVFAFAPRIDAPQAANLRRMLVILTLLVSGVLTTRLTREGIGGLICLSLTCGLVVLIVVGLINALRNLLPRDTFLVVGPAGLAVAQGHITGALRWSEVRGVRPGRVTGTLSGWRPVRHVPGLRIAVDGASVDLPDAFDRPLPAIQRVIELLWRGSTRCAVCSDELRLADGPTCPRCVVGCPEPPPASAATAPVPHCETH